MFAQIGSALNVTTVLEGSVRASGDRLRVISRLIDTADGRQLWSEKFERSLGDVFAVQDEIARAAVEALRVWQARKCSALPRSRFLRAPAILMLTPSISRGGITGTSERKRLCTRASRIFKPPSKKERNYAEGFAGLAEAYATLGLYGVLPPREVMPRAQTAARRALDVRGTLSGPFATLGISLPRCTSGGGKKPSNRTVARST